MLEKKKKNSKNSENKEAAAWICVPLPKAGCHGSGSWMTGSAEHPAERSPASGQCPRAQTRPGERAGKQAEPPEIPIFPRRSPTASSQTGISTGMDLARFG